MTISTNVLKANTVADIVSAINTVLAAWTAGASRKILGVSIILNEQDRLLGTEYQAIITSNDAGASAQADPYVIQLIQDRSPSGLQTALNAAIAVDATGFWTSARVISQDNPSRTQVLTAWIIGAATASVVAAAANWTPR